MAWERPLGTLMAIVLPLSPDSVVIGELGPVTSSSRPGPPAFPDASARSGFPAASRASAVVHCPSVTSIFPWSRSVTVLAALDAALMVTCSPALLKSP